MGVHMAKDMSLSTITTGQQPDSLKLIIYGAPGVGKTTFAAGFPAPIFIDTDDGSKLVDTARFPVPETFEDVLAALKTLQLEQHSYKTLVIDTLGVLDTLMATSICKKEGVKVLEDMQWGKGTAKLVTEWGTFVTTLNTFRARTKMDIILLSHPSVLTLRDPVVTDHDTLTIAVHKKCVPLLIGWSHLTGFATFERVVSPDKNSEKLSMTTTGNRVVHTVEARGFTAKTRLGFPSPMPFDSATFLELLPDAIKTTCKQLIIDIVATLDKIPEAKRKDIEPKVRETIEKSSNSIDVLTRCKDKISTLVQEK